jgi:hypothetical protein
MRSLRKQTRTRNEIYLQSDAVRALGIDVPATLHARSDEVIEYGPIAAHAQGRLWHTLSVRIA